MKQDPPFCVQVELTEGCNLFCSFCGIHGIREKPGNYKFMNVQLAMILAKQLQNTGWLPRIEFAMHGEPLLNKNAKEIIKVFRKRLPNCQLMLTSNGMPVQNSANQEVSELLDAGLNILAIDDYGQPAISKIKTKLPRDLWAEYPSETDSPHKRWSKKTKKIIFIEDIRKSEKGGHSKLINHCGCADKPLRKPLKARCAKPFRELSVRWDGNVAICCNDFRGVYKCGNITDQGVNELWQNEAFTAARKLLYNYQRAFAPCNICNSKSYRVGLLPDKLGKREMPEPSKIDKEMAFSASKGSAYSPVILRPWETSWPWKV